MKFEQVRGYHNLWTWLDSKFKGIDPHKSAIAPKAWFYTAEGEEVPCSSYQQMFQEFNERFGTNFIPDRCFSSRNTHFTIAMQGGDVIAEDKAPVVAPVDDKPQTSPLISLSADATSEASQEESEDVSDAPTVDWDYINGLGTDKKAKNHLEQYCKQFGIDLKKNKTFANMVADFKEFLESK